MLLEACASGVEAGETYPYEIDNSIEPWTVDTRAMIRTIAAQCASGHSFGGIAGTFHRTLGHMIKTLSVRLRHKTSLTKVCLSGGTFQNATLLSCALPMLRGEGFEVFLHSRVPANDGGISLGQAVVAASALKARS
jgi:hydrogenase maturation protein HypF